MARPAAGPAARLRQLELAKARAAKLKRGEMLSAQPMADLLNVRWPVLRDWCDDIPGFAEAECFVRGGNGIEWEFHPAKAIRFLISHFKREVERSASKARRLRKMAVGSAMDDAPDDMTIDEMAKMLKLATAIQEQRERQGDLVDGAKAAAAFSEFTSRIQQAVLRAGQEQDPNGRWSPEVRDSFENAMRSVLLQMERAGRDCLQAFRAA